MIPEMHREPHWAHQQRSAILRFLVAFYWRRVLRALCKFLGPVPCGRKPAVRAPLPTRRRPAVDATAGSPRSTAGPQLQNRS